MAIHPVARLCPKFLMHRSDRGLGLQCRGGGDTHMLNHTGILPKLLRAYTSMGLISVLKKNPYGTAPTLWKLVKSRGVHEIFFDGVCGPRSETPTQLRIFVKNGWIDSFLYFFCKLRPISKGFLPQKRLILPYFVRKSCEMGPSSKDFFDHWDTCLRIFGEKSNPFGRHIPRMP